MGTVADQKLDPKVEPVWCMQSQWPYIQCLQVEMHLIVWVFNQLVKACEKPAQRYQPFLIMQLECLGLIHQLGQACTLHHSTF